MQAVAKFEREFGEEAEPCPEPTIPDPLTLMIPELWLGEDGESGWEPRPQQEVVAAGSSNGNGRQREAEDDGVTFAWEEADPRIDPSTGEWREER